MVDRMPVTFLAHQAPVLPLKRWRPDLDGVAMVAGSVTPDLARVVPPRWALIFHGYPVWWDGHDPLQALTGGLVVGLLLTWSARRLVLPRLAGYLPDLGSFHLRDLRWVGRTRHRWWVVVVGVVIGTVTHLLLDLLTHTDRGLVIPGLATRLFTFAGRAVRISGVLQIVLSVGLSIFAIWEMREIGRRRSLCEWSGVEPLPSPPPTDLWLVRFAMVAASFLAVVVGVSQVHRGVAVVMMTAAVVGWLALCAIAVFGPRSEVDEGLLTPP